LGWTPVLALVAALLGVGREIGERLPGFVALFATGLGLLGGGTLQLPSWARLRRSQMEALGERAVLMASSEESPTRSRGSS